MEKEENLNQALNGVNYMVILREHEGGWGSKDFHAFGFKTIQEAEAKEKEVNDKNNLPSAPDYYIKARIETDPRIFYQYERLM